MSRKSVLSFFLFILILKDIKSSVAPIKRHVDLDVQMHIVNNGDFIEERIEIEGNQTLIACTLHSSQRTIIDSSSDSTIIIEKANTSCSVRIGPINREHVAEWKLLAETKIKSEVTVLSAISQGFFIFLRKGVKIENDIRLKTFRDGKIKFAFTPDYMLYGCYVKSPNNTIYQIFPKSNGTDTNISFIKTEKCTFVVQKTTLDYTGKWEIYGDGQALNGDVFLIIQPLDIIVEEKVLTIPPSPLTVIKGQGIEVSLSENVNNLKNCEIISPKSKKIYISNENNCKFKINDVQNEANGTWTIKGNGVYTLYASLDIIVKEKPNLKLNIRVSFGTPAKLIFGPENAVYCKALSPLGKMYEYYSGQCVINIDRISKIHQGNWIIKTGIPGSMLALKYTYNVEVEYLGEQTPGKIITKVNLDEDKNELIMTCKLLVPSMNSCKMIRSDGEIFILKEGIFYERYKCYMNSDTYIKNQNSADFVECGLKIVSPTVVDLNQWKCIITHGNNISTGSFLLTEDMLLSNTNRTSLSITATTPIISIKHTSYEFICTYPVSINFCWFISPNNTFYTVTPNVSKLEYEYAGDGLTLGQCGIKIKSSTRSDTGTWKCHIGTNTSTDITAEINVTVREKAFAVQKPQEEYILTNKLNISCQTFEETPLEYCYFIRPDNYGINPMVNISSENYNGTNLELGHCQITIYNNTKTNTGRWKCIAKAYNKNTEFIDAFTVYKYFGFVENENKNDFYT